MHLKPWISSRSTQPALSAALDILDEESVDPDQIEAITFRGKSEYRYYPANVTEPRGYQELVSSLPWAFAMAITGREPGPEWLNEEHREDERVRHLASKLRIEDLSRANDIWDSGVLIANESPNEVELMAGGRTYRRIRTYLETPGSCQNPMSREWLDRKFLANAGPVLGDSISAELLRRLRHLESESDINDLSPLLSPHERILSA
jgi:2-methylcitrate dehydratase PrpD